MNRYQEQLEDSARTLGINLINYAVITEDDPIIYMWMATSESSALAKAIINCSEEYKQNVNVIMTDRISGWSCKFDWTDCLPTSVPDNYDFSLVEFNGKYSVSWNSHWFKKLSENKFKTSIVLGMNWIRTPEEINIKPSSMNWYVWSKTDDETNEKNIKEINKKNNLKINEFFYKIWHNKRIVIKPSGWKCWWWIHILSIEDCMNNPKVDIVDPDDIILIQEKIDSYPISINWVKKDWNVRVLVTYDTSQSKHVVAWIIWRIDNDWAPVNRSISADYISLEGIAKLSWMSNEQYKLVKNSIEETAIKSVEVLVERSTKRENVPEFVNYQNLAGVDIIIDEFLEPVVLEVNDSNSGCMFELMKLEWVDALNPIAESIINKTNAVKLALYIEERSPQYLEPVEYIESAEVVEEIED